MKTKQIGTWILASLLVPATLSAQSVSAQTPLPPLAAPRPVVLPKVTQERLPNGLRLVVLEDHKQPALWLQLAVPAGSIRDPKEKVGLAVMTASLLDKGTPTRSESQIADLTDGLGASLGASAEDDYMMVSASGLSSYTDILFDLLADITLHPTFPDAEVNRYRTRTLASVTAAMAEGGTVATAALNRLVYGDHPYGNFSTGTEKTLPGITAADLKQFHQTYFAPDASTLFVVGDITPAQAREKALKVLGAWARKDIPAAPTAPRPQPAGDGKPKIVIVDRPDAAQTEIRIGQVTPGYADPQRIPGVVASILLGGGAFENRLMKEIRVKRGLTYGANSFIRRNKDAGQFSITTFTKNASTGEVVRVALEEVKKLQDTPPPDGELSEREAYITGTYSISLATPTGILTRLTSAILYGNGPEDLSLFTQRVQAVTPKDVQTVLQNLPIPANYVALVGNAKEIEPQVKDIGTVTVIPAGQLDLLSPTLLGSATTTAATPPPPTASDDAAKALLAATIKAHGGDAFLAVNAISFKGKGKLTTPPAQGSIEVPIDSATFITAMPGRVRFDLKTGFGDISLGSPGGGKPTWVIFSGQAQELKNDGDSSDPVVLILRAVKENLTVTSLAETPSAADGKKLKGFQITNAKGQQAKVFVEADTSLVRRVEMIAPMGVAIYELSGYKGPTNGIVLPYALKQSANGQELFNLTFDSFEVNPTINDAMFDKPK